MRLRRALPLVAAIAGLAACSSDNATAPAPPDNAALIVHFDSLLHSSSGSAPIVYSQFIELLAEGAPVKTGTITIDGATRHVNTIAMRMVGVSDGSPSDSVYFVGVWSGDGSDTAIAFISADTQLSAIAAIGSDQGISSNGTGSVTPGALGASCTTFTAPGDVGVPPTISCNLQSSVASFSIVLDNGNGPTVMLPQQTVKGIRAEVDAPPPPC